MGFFSRRDKVVDLTEDYKYEKKHPKDNLKVPSPTSTSTDTQESSSGSFFNFFGSSNTPSSSSSSSSSSPSSSSSYSDTSSLAGSSSSEIGETLDADEKRRRLAKRLKGMTDSIENVSNQIYLLQQRIDLLEKKTKTGKYNEDA